MDPDPQNCFFICTFLAGFYLLPQAERTEKGKSFANPMYNVTPTPALPTLSSQITSLAGDLNTVIIPQHIPYLYSNYLCSIRSVSDPHWSQCRSGSSILGQLRIQIQGTDGQILKQKLQLKKINVSFYQKLQFFPPRGLHKGRPSYRKSLQPSEENIQHFKT
jgi:hypothetical protein